MESLGAWLKSITNGQTINGAYETMLSISGTTSVIIIVMALLGTTMLTKISGRDSIVDFITAFIMLLVSALFTNALFARAELLGTSEHLQTAITANLGMAISALLLIVLYSRSWAD